MFGLGSAEVLVLLVVGLPLVHHEPTLRGTEKVVLAAAAVLPRGNCLLVWKGPPGATYEVEVRTLLGQSLDTARGLTATQYRVPESKLAGIPSGTRLEGQVTATLPGKAPLPSERFVFILR